MELEAADNPPQDQSLLNSRRNTIRALAVESAYRLTNESGLYLFLKLVYTFTKLTVLILVLRQSSSPLEKPLPSFLKLIVLYDLVYFSAYSVHTLGLVFEVSQFWKSSLKAMSTFAEL